MVSKIQVITVEDEVLIASALEINLSELGCEVIANYRSAATLLSEFKVGIAELIVMDIQLQGDMDGAQAGKLLSQISDIPIIYLTNVRDGAQKRMAIEHSNAAYYLAKPFNKSDLETALAFTLKKIHSAKEASSAKQKVLMDDSIFIREGQSYRPIKIDEIVYLKAVGSYCELYSIDKKYLYSENLSFFGDKLSFATNFVRIHRSYIVNADFIERIRENAIWVAGEELPIGRSFREGLIKRFRFLS